MSVHQIIYMSVSSAPFSDSALAQLLDVARSNNAKKNISGFLVYHKGSFIQVLEGQKDAVKATFNHINLDPRHADVQVLFEGTVEERTFEHWSMGYEPTGGLGDIPEGFHPFLKSGLAQNDETPSMARRALLAFKDGRWRANAAA